MKNKILRFNWIIFTMLLLMLFLFTQNVLGKEIVKENDDNLGKISTYGENFNNIYGGALPEGWQLSEDVGVSAGVKGGRLCFDTRRNLGSDSKILLTPWKISEGATFELNADMIFDNVNNKMSSAGPVFAFKDKKHFWQLGVRQLSTAERGVEFSQMCDKWNVVKSAWTDEDIKLGRSYHIKLLIANGRASSYIDNILISSFAYSGGTEGLIGFSGNGVNLYLDNVSLKVTEGKPDKNYKAKLYSPKTSIVPAPSVIGNSREDLFTIVKGEKRPSNIIVYPDKDLVVYTENGKRIADSLDDFYGKTADRILPIIYLKDGEIEGKVRDWINRNNIMDIAVMADYTHSGLVRSVTSVSEGVRGIVKYSSGDLDVNKDGEVTESELWNVVYTTNFNGGKIAVLDKSLANSERVRYLQKRFLNVWVECGGEKPDIYDAINTGADGIVSRFPLKVIDSLESYDYAGERVTQHLPIITGHRGQPTTNTENTLSGAIRGMAAGAEAIECDIWLTTDGVLAINHDRSTGGIFNKYKVVENSSWKELSKLTIKHPLNLRNREGMASLDQYFKEFRGKPVILCIELKETKKISVVTVLKELAQKYNMENQIVLISADKNLLKLVKSNWPGIPTGLLSTLSLNTDTGNNIAAVVEKNSQLGTVFQPNYTGGSIYAQILRKDAQERGLNIYPWTVSNAWEMDNLMNEGFSGMTTNAAYLHGGYVVSVKQGDISENIFHLSPLVLRRDGNTVVNPETQLIIIEGKAPSTNIDGSFTAAKGKTKAMLKYIQKMASGGIYKIYSNVFTING